MLNNKDEGVWDFLNHPDDVPDHIRHALRRRYFEDDLQQNHARRKLKELQSRLEVDKEHEGFGALDIPEVSLKSRSWLCPLLS